MMKLFLLGARYRISAVLSLVLMLSPCHLWAEAPAAQSGNMMSQIIFFMAIPLVLYFFAWRPQRLRAKEHRSLMDRLEKGLEVVTNGGIFGRVAAVKDDCVLLQVCSDFEITMQKSAIIAELPKGTIKLSQGLTTR